MNRINDLEKVVQQIAKSNTNIYRAIMTNEQLIADAKKCILASEKSIEKSEDYILSLHADKKKNLEKLKDLNMAISNIKRVRDACAD